MCLSIILSFNIWGLKMSRRIVNLTWDIRKYWKNFTSTLSKSVNSVWYSPNCDFFLICHACIHILFFLLFPRLLLLLFLTTKQLWQLLHNFPFCLVHCTVSNRSLATEIRMLLKKTDHRIGNPIATDTVDVWYDLSDTYDADMWMLTFNRQQRPDLR